MAKRVVHLKLVQKVNQSASDLRGGDVESQAVGEHQVNVAHEL